MVRAVVLSLVGMICSFAWLGLLIATGFATVPVCVGLLAALFLIGMTSNPNRPTW